MVPLNWYLMLSVSLFIVGLIGFLTRRSIIMMFLSVEIMLNAINISLIAMSHYMQDMRGQVLAFFVIACAAAGMAVGLVLLISAYRNKPTVRLEDFDLLKDRAF